MVSIVYSNLQQQALAELGIQVLDLQSNHQETQEQGLAAPKAPALNPEVPGSRPVQSTLNTQPSNTQTPTSSNRPSLSSLLNKPNTEQGVKPQMNYLPWQNVDEGLLMDLRTLFPNLVVDGDMLQLNNQLVWRLTAKPNHVSFEFPLLTTSDVESLLPHNKKAIWAFLADYAQVAK